MFLAINIAEISCVLCPVINQMFWSVLIILPSSAGLTSISYDQSEIGGKLKFLSAPNKLHIKKLKTNYCFENNDRSAGTAPYLICIEFNVESSYSAQQCWVLVKSWVSKNCLTWRILYLKLSGVDIQLTWVRQKYTKWIFEMSFPAPREANSGTVLKYHWWLVKTVKTVLSPQYVCLNDSQAGVVSGDWLAGIFVSRLRITIIAIKYTIADLHGFKAKCRTC